MNEFCTERQLGIIHRDSDGKLSSDKAHMNRCVIKDLAFKMGADTIRKKILGHDLINWSFKTCHSLHAHYIVIWVNDSLKRAMDVLAVEHR